MKKVPSDQVVNKMTIYRNTLRIVLKIILGIGVFAVLFFVAVNYTQQKFSQLSGKVTAILEPNIKLIKLKEISDCLYNAEANVKAYAISRDTGYLLNYETYVNHINSRLDTLNKISSENKEINIKVEKSHQLFSAQIDTLSELIAFRLNLFNDFIKLKTGKSSEDALLQVLKKVKINSKSVDNESAKEPVRSYIQQIFSKKNKNDKTSDTAQVNILKIISEAYLAGKNSADIQSSKEVYMAQREYVVMSRISFLLNRMEETELNEAGKRIKSATNETSMQIGIINRWIVIFGFLFAVILLYFIYVDVVRARRYRAQLLTAKVNAEKQASYYSLSLIEASKDPLITIDINGKITDVNEATVLNTGLPRENLMGSDFSEYFSESQKAREVYQEVFSKGSVADYPLTLNHKDGKLTKVLFNGSVFKDEKGIVQGVVVVARDITKQIMYEDELIAAKDKSEESTTLIEAFLANMSHEIRTPMNAIMGFADLLAKKNLGEKEKEYVKVIKTAGEKLLLIINDILDISKIEAGMMSFESVSFSIKETLKSLNVMFSERARQKNIELEFNCDKSVPDILRGDHTRLTQIIINLVDNAIKFTREGNVMMNVTMRNRDGNKVSVEFSVSDTGIGIPPEKINTIFERFTQAEKHTTRMYGGTGLGLSIARQLVELQGGEITVKSEINKGTVFTFWIPYTITTQTLEVSESVDSVCNMEYLSKLKVLLVEDSLLNVQLVSSLFSENNLNLQVAENGRLCLQMLKENEYDIVLMDMEMPVMNGYEATNEIRQTLKSNIPIIAITAHAMAGERERCLNLGMNDYVSKPINSVLLFEKMFELTKNKS